MVKKQDWWGIVKPEDHWSCIAHRNAEDMFKSAAFADKEFKHSQQEHLVTSVICCKFQKISLKSDFIQSFSWFYACIQLQVRGRQPQGTKFWCQQKPLVTSAICYKFKKNLYEVWFYTFFFMILYMYIAPGQGMTTPWGRNFNVNRNFLSLRSFVASLKVISLKSDFIHFFSWFYACI